MTKWMNYEKYKSLLENFGQLDVMQFFDITPTTDISKMFFVELAFLNYWNDLADDKFHREGVNPTVNSGDESWLEVIIDCDCDAVNHLIFIYSFDNVNRTRYGLQILRDENPVYERDSNQDPLTEWYINELANDATDENGQIIFVGDPYGKDN